MKECVSKKSSGSKSQQNLKKWSRLRSVGLNWDEHEDKAWSSGDEKCRRDSIYPESGLGVVEEGKSSSVFVLGGYLLRGLGSAEKQIFSL